MNLDFFLQVDSVIKGVALFSTAVFLIQAIITLFLGIDSGSDVDFDSPDGGGMDISDIVSFKGLIHFLLGFSWTGVFNGFETFMEVTIAVVIGLLFVIGLAYLYKKMLSLGEIVEHQKPEEVIGQKTEIIHYYKGVGKAFILLDGAKQEVTIRGDESLKNGDMVVLTNYKDHIYTVELADTVEEQSLKDYERLKKAADEVLSSAKNNGLRAEYNTEEKEKN